MKAGSACWVHAPTLDHKFSDLLIHMAELWVLVGCVALCNVLSHILCVKEREWNAAREEFKEQIAK